MLQAGRRGSQAIYKFATKGAGSLIIKDQISRNLAFYVREDANLWAHLIHSFHVYLSYLGSAGSSKKQESTRETSTSALLTMPKPLTVWTATNCGKLYEMGISDHLTCLLRNLYVGQEATVRTRHGKWTGSEVGKEYVKAVYCHPAHLTYMQSTS